jgi:signal transduction histidine kinase
MAKDRLSASQLQPGELKAVYAISRVVAGTLDVDQALDEIIHLARPVFIFDNAVLYLQNEESGTLEPAFARAIGRGRSAEADLSWGGTAAKKVFDSGKIYLKEAEIDPDSDRLTQGFYLGQPMRVGGQLIGALIFIRFGGPSYSEPHINLAEFIAAHVTQVLEHKRLVKRVATLEADKRLAELQSEFLATVSHELKTPLGFIKGYTTTLLRKEAHWNSEEQKDFLNIINEESDQLENLVNDLLDSSRLQSGTLPLHKKESDLAQLCSEVIGRMKNRYPNSSIEIETKTMNTLSHIDPNRMGQVVENLVSNAIKHAPKSKVILSIDNKDSKLMLSVRDQGRGIPAEKLQNIFERFYRIPNHEETVRGSGLGLFICKQIVEAHEGSIRVESSLGAGSTFTVELPKLKETLTV